MAKQSGDLKFRGRIGNLIFYEAFGQMLVRNVGKSGSSKRKKKEDEDEDNALKKRTNKVFEAASGLAKAIYAKIPEEKKKHGVFGRMTGIANSVLQRGGSEEEARKEIMNYGF